MPEIISMGEALVEIMRDKIGAGLDKPEVFIGPYPSGAPAIFADCASRLGGKVGYIGTVGNDDFGKVIRDRLLQDGVDLTYFKNNPDVTTGVAFVAYFADGSRKFLYHIRNAASGTIEKSRIVDSYFRGARFLHINGSAVSINDSWRETIYLAIQTAKKNRVKISFDPNIRPEILGVDKVRVLCQPILDNVSIVFPSGEEATMLTGKKEPEEACLALLERGAELVILKKGSQGSTVYSQGSKLEVPAFDVEEIDPTGAGDCFDAGFLVSLIQKRSLKESARYANAVGALAVTRRGPMEGAPFPEEVEKLMKMSKK